MLMLAGRFIFILLFLAVPYIIWRIRVKAEILECNNAVRWSVRVVLSELIKECGKVEVGVSAAAACSCCFAAPAACGWWHDWLLCGFLGCA